MHAWMYTFRHVCLYVCIGDDEDHEPAPSPDSQPASNHQNAVIDRPKSDIRRWFAPTSAE